MHSTGGTLLRRFLPSIALAACIGAVASLPDPAWAAHSAGKPPRGTAYLVYWDQNEESDVLAMPSGVTSKLVPPWDTNGQICVFPDRSGRFTVGYNPTVPSQHNPGGLKAYKLPPIGQEVDRPDGSFSGQALSIAGPFLGGDIPGNPKNIAAGSFNNDGSFTGCAFDRRGALLAADVGTAQGAFPIPSDGRLDMWFPPSYKSSCVVLGPSMGGTGPHHVDGSGGLSQPGTLALADNGDILLPDAGTDQVLRIDASSLPLTAAQCPGGTYPSTLLKTSVFFQGSSSLIPFPAGIARDPTCDCFAISSYFGNPSITFVHADGTPDTSRPGLPGPTLDQITNNPFGYNPFGMAFAPDGTLYFIDIHLSCPGGITNCGPTDYQGRLMRVLFAGGTPSPPQVVAGGFDFPISATVCVPAVQSCPYPSKVVRPSSGPSENRAPARGPRNGSRATAGFG